MPQDEELLGEEVEETPLEESSEEATEEKETEEAPSEEETEEKTQEYTKERFDGLMSARQKDRARLLEIEKEFEAMKQANQPQKKQEDVWVDYLYGKIKAKQEAEARAVDSAAQKELQDTLDTYPDLKRNDILDAAIKYKVNLMQAAGILQDIQSNTATTKGLTVAEIARKKSAGKIAGKPGGTPKAGLKTYNPEKDKGKSLSELIEEGAKELGL